MFGKKSENQVSPMKTNQSLLHNSLVKGSKLEGTVTSENDFRIDGEFIGNLYCQARVIIGPTGNFSGEVHCENAIIEGNFNGSMITRDVLEVREGAVIEGDVATNKLIVQSGSVFDVKCNMGDKKSLALPVQEPVLANLENGQEE